jgi:hypothetical protein
LLVHESGGSELVNVHANRLWEQFGFVEPGFCSGRHISAQEGKLPFRFDAIKAAAGRPLNALLVHSRGGDVICSPGGAAGMPP